MQLCTKTTKIYEDDLTRDLCVSVVLFFYPLVILLAS